MDYIENHVGKKLDYAPADGFEETEPIRSMKDIKKALAKKCQCGSGRKRKNCCGLQIAA